jgi:hypothetical protein
MLAHDALGALAVEDTARRARAAEAPADHRRYPPRTEPRTIATDVEDVGLDDQRLCQRRPPIRPRTTHHPAARLDGLDGLDGRDGRAPGG